MGRKETYHRLPIPNQWYIVPKGMNTLYNLLEEKWKMSIVGSISSAGRDIHTLNLLYQSVMNAFEYQNLAENGGVIDAQEQISTCTTCTYMMGVANAAKNTFGDAIDMVEYKFTIKENLAKCKKMGVANLLAAYLNGKLRFSSIVPPKEALENAVREVMK